MTYHGQKIEKTIRTTRTIRRDSPNMPSTRRASFIQSSPQQAEQTHEAEESQSSPQEVDTQDVTAMIEDYFKGDTRTLDAKREAITKNYRNRMKRARDEISSVFDEHEKRAARTRKAQLERLVALIKEKADIEKKMANSVNTLKTAHLCRAEEFQIVLQDRIKSLG